MKSQPAAPTIAASGPPLPIAVEGRNCWRTMRTPRVTFLIDGAQYFSAFAAAAQRARRSILIVGWDIHSRTRLTPDAHIADLPSELGPFLNALVARRRHLHAYVLDWDFAMVYALEREAVPNFQLGWRTHRRLHFQLDGRHPAAASHHQKVVVIDDHLAFVGGLDLTINRWDTPAHRADDPQRVGPDGTPYPPFHDAQVMVDGAAAEALGDLARSRWWRATGQRLRPPAADAGVDPWPPEIVPDITDARVAIARTEPAFDGQPAVREVEALYLDAIAAAQRTIYIENQYLTAARIGEVLCGRLNDPHGPEVVIVSARDYLGWLEGGTMGTLRTYWLQRLHAADRFGRLRVYYPVVPAEHDCRVNVHAKILIVDDRFARIGSANINNRSLGLDTECDVAVESEGSDVAARAIAGLRNRLLAEHLGKSPQEVEHGLRAAGSLVRAVDALRDAGRTLMPIPDSLSAPVPTILSPALLDPEGPIDADLLIRELLPAEIQPAPHHPFLHGAAVVLPLLALAAAWRWTALHQWIEPAALERMIAPLHDSALAPLWILAGYVAGGLLMVPVTALIVGTVLIFGALPGACYALLGSLASAITTYYLGQLLGRDIVRRVAGVRLQRLDRRLATRGVRVMATIRLLPVAPFTLVNLVAGASRIKFRDYVLGTLIGMTPGVVVLAVVGDGLARVATQTAIGDTLLLASAGLFFLTIGIWLRRRMPLMAKR